MEKTAFQFRGKEIPVIHTGTVVVGTGAAGFCAADRLWGYGDQDVCVVTEHVKAGTSRNTGSDKQTYYKLTLSGDTPDSVGEMAETLFEGGAVDGDHALCEAALSVPCFMNLVNLGVEFPKNQYGEYAGYKTDHDPRTRATSVGPYTSRRMTECLEAAVRQKGVPIFDHLQVVKIIVEDARIRGLVCLDTEQAAKGGDRSPFVLVNCKNIVYATGGPAGIYENTVYPEGHYGASGLAFEAGARGKNLTEWQWGLASIRPKWNVSGTYMQVLPRFVSTDANGQDPREFLFSYIQDRYKLLSLVFLKGYQWPFDVRKAAGGSSLVDILVWLEIQKGRRVFLDYRENPGEGTLDFGKLSEEARDYLQKAGACFGTPVERLSHMNAPAVSFYRERGVDLTRDMLEISLCAQHNNGGLDVDRWWRTNVEGFFAVGEAAGTHGIYRPGGSALNAGQVGATRAAEFIARKEKGPPLSAAAFEKASAAALGQVVDLAESALESGADTVKALLREARQNMSAVGGAIRNGDRIRETLARVRERLSRFKEEAKVSKPVDLRHVFRLRETLLCQLAYLSAMADYVENGGKSRGSALYTDPAGQKPYDFLPDAFAYTTEEGQKTGVTQIVSLEPVSAGELPEVRVAWRPVRPIPVRDEFFENVWREFRESGSIL
ncbi:MAG: FAD-binding protein [Fusobacteriaceae bacterium]|jgi:succinate dehydrogenase/fumarate reductase flavoprotein subunit|nr:FAD-binding protein [Fusobacteriaceae bacterium]